MLEKGKRYHKRKREEAMLMIANFRGGMRCHYELTPYLPTFEEPCEGKLEIDHINGGGTKDFKEKTAYHVYREIRLGERNLDELRLLCAKHNQWFQHVTVKDYRELDELRKTVKR